MNIYNDGSAEAALRIAYPAVLGRLMGEALFARILEVELVVAATNRKGVQLLKSKADVCRWLAKDVPLKGFDEDREMPARATDGLPADTAALLAAPTKLVETARKVAMYGAKGQGKPGSDPALKAMAERLLQAFAEVADKAA